MTRRSIIGASSSQSPSIHSRPEGGEEDVAIPPTEILKIMPSCLDDNDNDDDENDSQVSSVSSLSSEGDSSRSALPASSDKPRAIFDRYWKAEGTTPSRKLCPPRSSSPMSVMADPYSYRPPYPYDSAMALLWLEEANSRPENDADSLNTYERTLNDCEVVPAWRVQQRMFSPYMNAPLWMSWFGKTNASAPSLHTSALGGNLSLARQVQSDSALHVKPRRSALRQGRFSEKKATTNTNNNTNHVHFQPRIQVCSYEQPLENWAEQGWSQWFGS